MKLNAMWLFIVLATGIAQGVGVDQDTNENQDSLFMFNPGQMSVEDEFTTSTMNALGVGREYLATLEMEGKLIRSDSKRWERLTKILGSRNQIVSVLRKMLADENVPQEFLFLAMAESGFKVEAFSSKKASGIWQLMPATAKELGMKIDEYVDERRDPIKSTQAAIKYLKHLYRGTGKWYLAAMAYNCGLGCVRKAIKKAGCDDIAILLDERGRVLPSETRNYLKNIMSMSLAFSDAHNLKLEDKQHLLNIGARDSIVAVSVNAGNLLSSIARSANMNLEDLKALNRHFKYNFIPPNRSKYQVYIPYDKLSHFKQNFKETGEIHKIFVIHKVKKGDTLSSISRKYKVRIAHIKDVNSLKSARLSINQRLVLPILRGNKGMQLASREGKKNPGHYRR